MIPNGKRDNGVRPDVVHSVAPAAPLAKMVEHGHTQAALDANTFVTTLASAKTC